MHFLTLEEGTPYLSSAIRPIAAIASLILAASCATDGVSRTEHAEVLVSLRALRDENARLEARLEKLETRQGPTRSTAMAPSAPAPAPKSTGSDKQLSSNDAMPPLAVVKLKPRRDPAPKIDTSVEIEEPSESVLAEVAPADVPDNADQLIADAQFERGMQALKTGNSELGIAQMKQFTTDWPRHPRADNALYLSGLAMMADKDYGKASESFERVVVQYPAGDAVLDSLLKLAECNLKLNHPREARATWEQIVSHYPGTAAATTAQARLASSSVASP